MLTLFWIRFGGQLLLALLICTWTQKGSAFCVATVTSGASKSPVSRKLTVRHSDDYSPAVKAKVCTPYPKIQNIYDRLTFSWVNEIMIKGNANPLELEDLWVLPESKRMRNSSETFELYLEKEKVDDQGDYATSSIVEDGGSKNVLAEFWQSPITRATVKMYKAQFIKSGVLKFFNTCVQFTPSLIVARILNFITSEQAAKVVGGAGAAGSSQSRILGLFTNRGFHLSALLFLSLCMKTILENQYFDLIARFSAEIRGTLSTAIYRKSLKLSPASRQNNTMGEIVNYMQLDTNRMEYVAGTIHTVWDGFLQIAGYTLLLVQFLGVSVFAGIAAMLVILPLNAFFLLELSKLKEKNLKNTDGRVKLTNEILQGIRAIKSYNWETPFAEQLQRIRNDELTCLQDAASVRALLVSTLSTAPSLVAVCSLGTYALLGNTLTPTKVFTSLALFNQLRFPLIFFPMLLNNLAEGIVSLRRLTKFFLTAEIQNYITTNEEEWCQDLIAQGLSVPSLPSEPNENVIRISEGSFSWSGADRSSSQGTNTAAMDATTTTTTTTTTITTATKTTTETTATTTSIAGNSTHTTYLNADADADADTDDGVDADYTSSEVTSPSSTSSTTGSSTEAQAALAADNRDRLVNINLNIQKGELVAVIGPTGSGKSSILNALLGELHKDAGAVMVKGQVAYASQSSWIPNDSLRNVILFGKPMNEQRYRKTLRMCDLEKDLELLESGDMTEIGERGINLSGGQKQRVSMARAVYDDADVYLLDDPLSALDTEVGAKIFQNCIKRGLSGKTRVLVTHQLGVLPEVDRIVLMDTTEDGSACQVRDQGTFQELIDRGHDLTKYVKEEDSEGDSDKDSASETNTAPSSNETERERGEEDSLLRGADSSSRGAAKEVSSARALAHAETAPTGSGRSADDVASTGTGTSRAEALATAEPQGNVGISTSATGTGTASSSLLSSSESRRDIYVGTIPPTGAIVDCCPHSDCSLPTEDEDACAPVPNPADVESLALEETASSAAVTPLKVSTTSSTANIGGESVAATASNGGTTAQPSTVERTAAAGKSNAVGDSTENSKQEKKKMKDNSKNGAAPVKLMTKEERAEGTVGFHVYKSYIQAANKPLLIGVIMLSFAMANASQILQQWVVAAWTSDIGYVKRPLPVYLAGTALMAAMVAFFQYSRTYLGVVIGASASRTIHRRMIQRVMGAPLSFFESTPVGRLVQRFSKDLDQIDQQIPNSFGQLIASSLAILGSMCAIMAVTPSFGFVVVGLSAVYFHITNYYRNVARELKRLEAISRSPVYNHFSETLGGLPLIRSFKRQAMYLRNNEVRLDDNISSYNSLKMVDRWLSFRLEVLGNVIVLFSALLAVVTGSRAGSAGLSLNNALGVTGLLNWAVRNGAETESLMNSVERVMYTINETPQEAAREIEALDTTAAFPLDASHYTALQSALTSTTRTRTRTDSENNIDLSPSSPPPTSSDTTAAAPSPPPPVAADSAFIPTLRSDRELVQSGWPWQGGVVFSDVQMRYRGDFDLVLRGVDVSIQSGERLGIVGRTGSGKSSLFRGLLRLTEFESGKVTIDGVNIANIGLDALRSSISVIPQDPVLFSGSIRMNLDPFNVHTDEALWAALQKAKLGVTVMNLPGGLSYEVTEGGDNFSLGQRQLLCLARALVRKSRILLLDEATSSVDYSTDALIQETIRNEFGDGATTVLTIAHRLETIMDADKILVMDAGVVGEYASPAELLSDPNSLFSELVAAEQRQRVEEEQQQRQKQHHPHAAGELENLHNTGSDNEEWKGKSTHNNVANLATSNSIYDISNSSNSSSYISGDGKLTASSTGTPSTQGGPTDTGTHTAIDR